MKQEMSGRSRFRARALRFLSVLVLVALVLSSLPLLAPNQVPSAPGARESSSSRTLPGTAAAGPSVSTPAAALPPTFFQSQSIPLPKNSTCPNGPFGNCYNGSVEPSINYTSTGLVAVAYTAVTNGTPCGNGTPSAQSVVGFTSATGPGHAWSAPTYLADPVCSTASTYPSAWQPSLTSLPNGTLALTYVQYNMTGNSIPAVDCSSITSDRLVFTRSFNNGTTWTTPVVLNDTMPSSGSCPTGIAQRPWIADSGQTLYVAWENLTPSAGSSGGGSVHLRVSKDGGATWGTRIDLPAIGTSTANLALNPVVAVDPSGRLYITYASNDSFATLCAAGGCGTYEVEDVVVATSTNNGTTISVTVAAHEVPLAIWNAFIAPVTPYNDPAPRLAWGARFHQMFLTYVGGVPGSYCQYPSPCLSTSSLQPGVFVTNSSTFGASWSVPRPVSLALLNGSVVNFPTNQEFNPAMAVDGSGRLHLEMGFSNASLCANTTLGNICGALEELYVNSTDNGTTFSPPVVVDGNVTPYSSFYAEYMWMGAYGSVVVRGSALYLAYAAASCGGWNLTAPSCGWGANSGAVQVTVSEPFTGTGIAINFHAHGVPSSVNWSVSLLGWVGSAPGNQTIGFSGIPTGEPVTWVVPEINVSGTIYFPIGASSFGYGNFTTSQSILVNFTELIQIQIGVTPLPSSSFGFQTSLTPTPGPGIYQGLLGTPLQLNISPNPCLFCDEFLLTFLSWSGTGLGSYSGLSPNVTVTPLGPVNETANFQVNGYCTFFPTFNCQNYTDGLTFLETGLPNGTTWSVSFNGSTSSSNSGVISDPNVTAGVHPFSVWTIPSGTPGREWVGSPSVPSPLLTPSVSVVAVTFSLATTTSESFPVVANTTGLPTGSNWSLAFGGPPVGATAGLVVIMESGGTSVLANGTAVLEPNGTEYRVSTVTTRIAVENSTGAVTAPAPARVVVNGTTWLTLHYRPFDRVTVTATTGGSAGPASQWISVGRTANVTESPAAGFEFQGWSGSFSGTSTNLSFVVNAPVREVAAFRPIPAPHWTVQLATNGLPAGVNASFQLGSADFSGPNGALFQNFSTGWYTVSAPSVTDPTGAARYVVVAAMLAPGGAPNGSALVNANSTLTISYSTEFPVTVASAGGGTTTPGAGVVWVHAAGTLPLTATPNSGQRFLGWTGVGAGAVSSSGPAISLTVIAAVTESATFGPRPPSTPATFVLTINESGLAFGTSWSVTGAGAGGSATGRTLVVAGLNGTYTIVASPVVVGPGVRFVPSSLAGYPETVGSNRSITIVFHAEYLLTVTATAGGSAGPASSWWNASASAPLTETPAAGYRFVGWTGNGTGAYNGTTASPSVTVGGPVFEVAQFTSTAPGPSSSGGTGSFGGSLLLALVVLAVGAAALLGAVVLARRRREGRSPGAPPPASEGASTEAPPMADSSEAPTAGTESPAPGDAWNETPP
jgi:BNR repeat protein/List-Bact-rpt repeat protein